MEKSESPPYTPRSRATKEKMEQRVDMVIDLMVRHRKNDRKIKKALMENEPISEKTAQRAIQTACLTLGGIGRQATDEERGLLWERLDDLYSEARQKGDLALATKITGYQMNLSQQHPQLKQKGDHHDYSPPTGQSISPELEAAIQDFADAAKIEEPEGNG